ncbi:MAG TPA: ferritin [Anaerolineae bacterium]|nr:ferritin [Anaerolineae bacterium]
MFSERLQAAINDQINAEYYSAYLYLSMAAYLEYKDLPGMAHWMRMQYEEEVFHALKFFDFMNDRGARVILRAIDAPPSDFGSVEEVFAEVLAHEQKVTALIHNLYKLAVEENDYPTQSLLQWFIDEQVEEEKAASDVLARVRMVKDYPPGILMIDDALGQRPAPTPPAAEPAP